MEAVVVSRAGGPESLEPTEVDDPVAGPGEVLVDVVASGVNFIDVYHRSGRYPIPTPFTPGLEGAGRVRRVGSGVAHLSEGDLVAWAQVPASYATAVVAPAASLVPVPDGVEARTAAAIMLQGMTAHYLCHDTYPVREGDTVLIHAAAGGVGTLLTQLVKARGGTVIATVSTSRKADLARQAGADHVVDYEGFDVAVKDLTGGRGAAAVYDGVGADTFKRSLRALRSRGTLALFGQSSGAVPPVDPQALSHAGSVYLTRPTLAHYIADPEEFVHRAADLFTAVVAGELKVRVGGEYPLAEAARAHEDLEARRSTGKLLLV